MTGPGDSEGFWKGRSDLQVDCLQKKGRVNWHVSVLPEPSGRLGRCCTSFAPWELEGPSRMIVCGGEPSRRDGRVRVRLDQAQCGASFEKVTSLASIRHLQQT